jgi:methionyl-tRNA formyltransferase
MKPGDRIILFATGVLFSQTVLDTLLAKKIKPAAIVLPEYPPAPMGNLPGAKIEFAGRALKLSLPIIYAPEKSQHRLPGQLSAIQADYILLACWPYLLSTDVTGLANKAALNIHPSLLPRYRGANPIAKQLAHREGELGVTLHLLNEKFDQGDILAQAKIRFPSGYPEKQEIEIETAKIGASLFIDAMKNYAGSDWRPVKQ